MRKPIGRIPAEVRAVFGTEAHLEGRVKFYDATKSYGYIAADSGDDYFFNSNSFRDEAPRKGDHVEFCGERGPKGLIAKRLQVTARA